MRDQQRLRGWGGRWGGAGRRKREAAEEATLVENMGDSLPQRHLCLPRARLLTQFPLTKPEMEVKKFAVRYMCSRWIYIASPYLPLN